MKPLPYTLAHILERYHDKASHAEWQRAMNYMLDFFEISSQYLSLVLLNRLRRHLLDTGAQPSETLRDVVRFMDTKRPMSLGDWCNDVLRKLVVETRAQLPQDPVMTALWQIINKRRNIYVDSVNGLGVVASRNTIRGHATTMTDTYYQEQVRRLEPQLTAIEEAVAPIGDWVDEHELFPLIHTSEEGYVYVFQTLKEDAVSFVSADERAATLFTDAHNTAINAWFRTFLPAFDVSRETNWLEYIDYMSEQSEAYLQTIYLQKKYNRELYVNRDSLDDAYRDFMASGKQLFPLLGQAGQGKTNQLCHWVETLLQNKQPVLILSGTDFTETDLPAVLRNLFRCSRRKKIEDVLLDIERKAETNGALVHIFFDAVNECILYPDTPAEEQASVELFRDIATLFANPALRNFRVLFTCRNYTWQQYIVSELKSFDTGTFFGLGQEQDYAVRGFSDREVRNAYAVYGALYKMQTDINDLRRTVVLRLKDPLVLKIACTNYLGRKMPEDSLAYTSNALFSHMSHDIACAYAGAGQKAVLQVLGELFLACYEAGTPCDTVFLSELSAPQATAEQKALRTLILNDKGITIAFGELLNRPERPILRLIDGEKLQFVYERYLEYVMAHVYYNRFRSQNLTAENILHTIHTAAFNEVMMSVLRNVLLIHYAETGEPQLLVELITRYGEEHKVIMLVKDCTRVLAAEHYEQLLVQLENELLAQNDSRIRTYNELNRKILAGKTSDGDISAYAGLVKELAPVIRARHLAADTLVNTVFLTDFFNENLYAVPLEPLFRRVLADPVDEVKDRFCLSIYYLSFKHRTDTGNRLTRNITLFLIEYMQRQVTRFPVRRWVFRENGVRCLVSFLITSIRLQILLIIDNLLAETPEGRDKAGAILDQIRRLFSRLTGHYTLLHILLPFLSAVLRKQFNMQQMYCNNVTEFSAFWQPQYVSPLPSGDVWSRADLAAAGPYFRLCNGEFSLFHNKVLQAYRTGDALSYFALERIIVVQSVTDINNTLLLWRALKNAHLEETPWWDYSQMSLIYSLYQIGMKAEHMPDELWTLLSDWCRDWTLRCRGYYRGHNSHRTNPLGLYKRNVMAWYCMVYCRLHGDTPAPDTVPLMRDLMRKAVEERDKELLMHLIGSINELVTDAGQIYTTLDLLREMMAALSEQEDIDAFERNINKRYPDTAESIVIAIGRILSVAGIYFNAQVSAFLNRDTVNLTFPGLALYNRQQLNLSAEGEKLSDLFTHRFGNFIIWALIHEPAVDDTIIRVLAAAAKGPADEAPEKATTRWVKETIRIVLSDLFNTTI